MTGFLDLPWEVRNEIYKLSLVHPEADLAISPISMGNEEAFPNQYLEGDYRLRGFKVRAALALGLLSTCHFVRVEAIPVFYGNNLWHLHSRCFYLPSTGSPAILKEPFLSNLSLFRHVLVRFDPHDLSPTQLGLQWWGRCVPYDDWNNDISLKTLASIYSAWETICSTLESMALTNLWLDLSDCETIFVEELIWEPTLLGRFADCKALEFVHSHSGRGRGHYHRFKKYGLMYERRETLAVLFPKHMRGSLTVVMVECYKVGVVMVEELHELGFYCKLCRAARDGGATLVAVTREKLREHLQFEPYCPRTDGESWDNGNSINFELVPDLDNLKVQQEAHESGQR